MLFFYNLLSLELVSVVPGTVVQRSDDDGTMIINSEMNTLVESNLGTMIINNTDEDEEGSDSSLANTMKR